jgi:hypothetical protein
MESAFIEPSIEEIESIACGLIRRHGLGAYDEAIRISEVYSRIPHTLNWTIYRQVADHIEQSFAVARQKLREKKSAGQKVLELVARLNSQDTARERAA